MWPKTLRVAEAPAQDQGQDQGPEDQDQGPEDQGGATCYAHSRHDQRLVPGLAQQAVHKDGGAGKVVDRPGASFIHAEPGHRDTSVLPRWTPAEQL